MASEENVFEDWLCEKLNSLELDTDIYLDYFKGVFEDCSTPDDITESLNDILSGVIEDQANIAEEILQAWQANNKTDDKKNEELKISNFTVNDDKIKNIIEKQQQQINKKKVIKKQNDDDDEELKKKMIASYGELSSEGEGDDSDDDRVPSNFVNTNAQVVADKESESREKLKKESDEKKINDKLNREKEKMKKEERAEKEKKRTQKGERRAR